MTPQISVIVCTYNRCESLRDTLQSLNRQVLDVGQCLEVIVIDNRSTDHTRAVVQDAAAQSPWPCRYIMESQQGVSYARNKGLMSAHGDYVAFIDDDAIADQRWIAALMRCFLETNADLIGGKIEPLWLTKRPAWLNDELMGPIISLDWGARRTRCEDKVGFLTTNCAMKRLSVKQFGKFDVGLGRRGTRWLGGEDFELCHRWQSKGAILIYEPAAIVQHKVIPERVTPEFYRHWFEDIGYTQGHQVGWKSHYRVSIMPIWRWIEFCRVGMEYAMAHIPGVDSETRQFQTQLWWIFQLSFFKECWRHWIGAQGCAFSPASEMQRGTMVVTHA